MIRIGYVRDNPEGITLLGFVNCGIPRLVMVVPKRGAYINILGDAPLLYMWFSKFLLKGYPDMTPMRYETV